MTASFRITDFRLDLELLFRRHHLRLRLSPLSAASASCDTNKHKHEQRVGSMTSPAQQLRARTARTDFKSISAIKVSSSVSPMTEAFVPLPG